MRSSLAVVVGCCSISHGMSDPQPFDLAERVARIARSLGVDTALIGASALAIYGYVRGTSDIDFASVVNPFERLPALSDALRADGFHAQLHLPDEEDVLGGVLRIWMHETGDGDPIDPIEIVNFDNPYKPLRLPVNELVRDSVELAEKPSLRYVRLPHLILLKLYAGSRQDLADVVALLERNPDADVEQIRASCKRYGLDAIDVLIAEVEDKRITRQR